MPIFGFLGGILPVGAPVVFPHPVLEAFAEALILGRPIAAGRADFQGTFLFFSGHVSA
jgi:hypothetical protein